MSKFLTARCHSNAAAYLLAFATTLAAAPAYASPKTCLDVFKKIESTETAQLPSLPARAGQLPAPVPTANFNPHSRALSIIENNEAYLVHGKRGGSTFVQMALFETNETMKSVARWILTDNVSPLKSGTEIEISQATNEVSSKLDQILNQALEMQKPRGFFSKLRKDPTPQAQAKLDQTVKEFFQTDVKKLELAIQKTEQAFDSIDLEQNQIESRLQLVSNEKLYVKSLIDRIGQLRLSHSTASQSIDLDVDFDLNEKLKSILEHEITLEQSVAKLELRRSQLRLAMTQITQVQDKIPVTAAHIPSFMKAAQAYQAKRDEEARKREADLERRKRSEVLRIKNEPRRARVQELREKQAQRKKEIANYWVREASNQNAIVFHGNVLLEGRLTDLDGKMNRATLEPGSTGVRLDSAFLTEVPEGMFDHKIGAIIKDKLESYTGRIIALDQHGDAVVETAFGKLMIERRLMTLPNATELRAAERTEQLKSELEKFWVHPDQIGTEVFTTSDDGIVRGKLVSNQGAFVVSLASGMSTITKDELALSRLPRGILKFKVGDTVTDGTRIGVVLAYFPSGYVVYKSTSSTRQHENFVVENEANLFAAKVPKPDLPIGSQHKAVQDIYGNKVQTTYTVVAFDPQTNSYLVEPRVDYIKDIDAKEAVSRYAGYNNTNHYTEGKKPQEWLTPDLLEEAYGPLMWKLGKAKR